jgi:hypothetical protein
MDGQIAVKNLQSINDILDAEKLHYEKLSVYSSLVKDSNLKKLITKLQNASQTRFDTVYEYLKSHQ